MHAVQQPLAVSALQDVMGVPAWSSRPCWYLVATDDQAIPPDAERHFAARMGATTFEVPSGHLAMVSHPDEVAHSSKPLPRLSGPKSSGPGGKAGRRLRRRNRPEWFRHLSSS